MPSLFSRSRTQSTPAKSLRSALSPSPTPTPSSLASPLDEFGRVGSKASASNVTGSGKKDKKKDKEKDKERSRARTLSARSEYDHDGSTTPDGGLSSIPDGSFLALNLDPPSFFPNSTTKEVTGDGSHGQNAFDYGHLSYARHVVLGLDQAQHLITVLSAELSTRGLTTPFIFSTLALDISANAIKSLIRAFLRYCEDPADKERERAWRDEARFAGPNELGMCLRWGLARLVRVHGGQEVRGLIAYEWYSDWRDAEATLKYPPNHFSTFLSPLTPPLRTLLTTLLNLLSRLTAHSALTGHTPPTLSPLFGPLFFGLGPSPSLSFHHTYHVYLRSANAMEHLILAFVRWQDHDPHSSPTGVPTKLKEWIRDYPAMLPTLDEEGNVERPSARRGARTIRAVSVRRNVRMYSSDLVKTGASWASSRMRVPGSPSPSGGGLANSREWTRIAPPTLKLPPRYSDAYRKRMDLPPNFYPSTGAASASSSSLSSAPSTSSTTSSTLWEGDEDTLLEGKKGEVRSLTDLKWGEFETLGFGNLGADEKKLQFDLTEGARAARAAKRATLTWQDFSTSGFSRTDAPLSATLQFSMPVSDTITAWPTHSAELHKKLKKAQKALPAFGWDTEPVMGGEEVVEEAFLDVFCDLVYGGGWMDRERCEDVDRECNWALVEFKSLPVSAPTSTPGAGDPRTSTTLILFEEFVPLEYRQQLTAMGSRRRLPSLFALSKSKAWKPAATLNGRPYVVGRTPPTPSMRELEFEGLLRGENQRMTKIVMPEGRGAERPGSAGTERGGAESPNGKLFPSTMRTAMIADLPRRLSILERAESPGGASKRDKEKNGKRKVGLPSGPASGKRSGLTPSESRHVDFETRLAGYSDEEVHDVLNSAKDGKDGKDDAWVDILVSSQGRRLNSQDVDLDLVVGARDRRRRLGGGRSDPDLAGRELSEALVGVQRPSLSEEEGEGEGEGEGEEEEMEPVPMPMSASTVDHGPYGDEEYYEDAEEEEGEEERVQQATRRLGYFDLHPERRPVSIGGPESIDTASHDHMSEYSDLSGEGEGEGAGEGEIQEVDGSGAPVVVETMSVPGGRANVTTVEPVPSKAGAGAGAGKTATLIEMFRERERAGAGAVPKLPSLPADKEKEAVVVVNAGDDLPPPILPVVEGARSVTPPRYVHGAPLHNVLEEEEEE